MVTEVTGLGKVSEASAGATLGHEGSREVVIDMYMAVNPSSVCPAPARKGQVTSKKSAS